MEYFVGFLIYRQKKKQQQKLDIFITHFPEFGV